MTCYQKRVFLVIFISLFFRLFWANQLEFGNDEVYYWLYARYPDISHFDHPPMVGFFIQLFSLNLFFDSELAIRLASILPASASMYLVYLIGKFLKDERTGFIATLLYNLSIYGLVISGTFILPDAPLVFFWLLSFYFFIQTITENPDTANTRKLLLAFLFLGCAIYSKYQAVYLLFGVVMYVLIFNRKWLVKWQFYLSFILPALAVFLIFYWNYKNDFISYKFHGNRVSFFNLQLNITSFSREVFGQFIYNNPYNFIMVIVMLVSSFRKKFMFKNSKAYLFFWVSFPLIFTTLYLSISRDTLPHWSGISYLTLMPLLAVFLAEKTKIHKILFVSFLVLCMLNTTVVFLINKGWFLPIAQKNKREKLGAAGDLLDMYGWKQASKELTKIIVEEKLQNLPIISPRWYPASHIDYYIAKPNKMKVYGVGNLNDIHKYYWINKINPKLKNEVLYITDSRNYQHPKDAFNEKYQIVKEIATIPIKRGKVVVKYVFIFKLKKELLV